MDVIMLRNFASQAEVAEIRQWILSLRDSGILNANTNGPSRFYVALRAVPKWTPAIERINRDLKAKFGITGKCIELTDSDAVIRYKATESFVGMQTEGGNVHPHIDPNIGDKLQFRCTLLVNKPEFGGKLVLGGDDYEMDEGDIYCFVSNETVHGTTGVSGSRPRMSCSLGYLVDKPFKLEDFAPAV